MNLDLSELCRRLGILENLKSVDKALALLWFKDHENTGCSVSASEMARVIRQYSLGNPNVSKLAIELKRSKHTLSTKTGFQLKAGSRDSIQANYASIFVGVPKKKIESSAAYIPEEVWRNTRGYIERVCEQLNGCYFYAFYDAVSIMLRRLMETLVIEAYEHLGRQSEIRGKDGNYFMLGELVAKATDSSGLGLGREAKRALLNIKTLGDRSAHNRRFNAVRSDLAKLEAEARVAVDELINISQIRKV